MAVHGASVAAAQQVALPEPYERRCAVMASAAPGGSSSALILGIACDDLQDFWGGDAGSSRGTPPPLAMQFAMNTSEVSEPMHDNEARGVCRYFRSHNTAKTWHLLTVLTQPPTLLQHAAGVGSV
jgi:hypothetical protein